MKTLKTLALLLVGALAFVGCNPVDDGGNEGKKGLVLIASKTTIYDNGIDGATFTLYYDGMVLNNGYELYIGDGAEMVTDNKFTSTTQGTFEIWAAYGATISNTVNINVIATPPPAPAVPEDANPSKTNFKRRVMLTQFTGTGCGYCPLMMNALYQLMSSNDADKVVLTAAHIGDFAGSDPANLLTAKTLDNALGVYSFPDIVADMVKNTEDVNPFYANVLSMVNSAYNRISARGGIAVSSKYYAEEEYIVINTLVKASQTAEFRIGAWLLEDGISAQQAVSPNPYNPSELIQPIEGLDFNIHNNCIRTADSRQTNLDFTGHSLGVIEAGKTASREFAFKLLPNAEKGGISKWNHNNLRLVVFIATKEGSNWYINNAVMAPKDGSVDFEYAE